MSLDYICDHYRVPAQIDGRIRFTWPLWDHPALATIVGAEDARLKVRFDDGTIGHLHPTWEVEYLGGGAA